MISAAGLSLLRREEELRLVAYPDPASGGEPWTIGYGHTQGVREGDTCTKDQAEKWLLTDCIVAENALHAVSCPLSQNQRDALISFVFNIGPGVPGKKDGFIWLKSGEHSTLLKKLNAGDFNGAAEEFLRWDRAAGRQLPGLRARRERERALFLNNWAAQAAAKPEKPVLPFIAAAIPALIQAAPALIRIFGDSPQSEKNAKAAEAVAQIAQEVTGQPTTEGAVGAIQGDPAVAAAFRERCHQSMGQLLGHLLQASEADEKSRETALSRNLQLAGATGGRWLWLLGGVALLVVLASYAITGMVLFNSGTTFSDETKALLLGQVVIFGFMTVLAFLFGSNIQNRISQAKET